MGQVSTSSSCGEKDRQGCPPAASRSSQGGDVRQSAAPSPAIRKTMQAASTTSWLGTKNDSKANSRSPVVWLEEPNALGSSRVADGVSINGINVSDQRLEEVQGTLKPDGSGREFKLALEVEGAEAKEESVIPARARFGMRAKIPKTERSSGGANSDFSVQICGTTESVDFVSQPIDGRASCRSGLISIIISLFVIRCGDHQGEIQLGPKPVRGVPFGSGPVWSIRTPPLPSPPWQVVRGRVSLRSPARPAPVGGCARRYRGRYMQ